MKAKQSFQLVKFTNPSGGIVFRVSGVLDGKRIRRNFATINEASAERDILSVRAGNISAGLRTVITRLSDDELREAEAAFATLRNGPESLTTYLSYAIATYKRTDNIKPLDEALAEYLHTKKTSSERGQLSTRQFRSIRHELAVFEKWFSRKQLAEISRDQLRRFFERGSPSLKTINNRRGIASTFFKLAFQSGWIQLNPVSQTQHHRIGQRGTPTTLNADCAAELMAYVERNFGGRLVPYFATTLFAGIRPDRKDGEISKLTPVCFRLDTQSIHVEPSMSKVRTKRVVTIQPNLDAWLRAYPLERFPLIATNAKKLVSKVVRKFGLSHDILRHTFISMHVGKYRSVGEAALQAGNSEHIIRKHYLDVKSIAESNAFFSIVPSLRSIPAAESAGDSNETGSEAA